MENELLECLKELTSIRKYLIKKGKSRYKGNVIESKLYETEIIYEKSKELIELLSSEQGIRSEGLTFLYDEIKSCYLTIHNLCTQLKPYMGSESDSKSRPISPNRPNTESIMEFDLRTACSLIPVMNSNENNIKSIIDAVEMYADMLSEPGKKLLITFVLKSRLSENAKLRMSNDYTSTNDFVRDLRETLLPKKSFTAIQSRLQNITQGWHTIDQYGTELEKLFTNLTISQADGDHQSYSVLKPLNEKLAIKRFADGLKDTRLSTIIAARNYDSLKDAIQAAKDEELTAASTSAAENVMQFSRRGRGKAHYNNFKSSGRFYNQHSRGHRGFYNHQNPNNFRGNYNNYANIHSRGNFGCSRSRPFYHSRGNGRASYNNSARGRSYQVSNENRSSYKTRSRGNQHQAFYTNESVNSNTNEMQFFRS